MELKLVLNQPAIDVNHLAGDIGGRFGGNEFDHRRHLVLATLTAHRYLLIDHRRGLRRHCEMRARILLDKARRNHVHGDPL